MNKFKKGDRVVMKGETDPAAYDEGIVTYAGKNGWCDVQWIVAKHTYEEAVEQLELCVVSKLP